MDLKRAMRVVFDLANENALGEDFAEDDELDYVYAEQQAALKKIDQHFSSGIVKAEQILGTIEDKVIELTSAVTGDIFYDSREHEKDWPNDPYTQAIEKAQTIPAELLNLIQDLKAAIKEESK